MTPVLRFAPSPTGMLHIGGARTALFNWLYARHTGGKFLLRIEDTDRERSTPEAVAAILNGMKWLELDHDGEITYQFERAPRHREVAELLLSQGRAYRCYATPAELDEMRAAQRAAGKPIRYDGRWRDKGPKDAPEGAPFVIRLKAQDSGETIIRDIVQGDVRFANEQLDDMILLRSDGTPTYMLAVVVDDYDMGVTHIIRGDDHLNNAARQMQLIKALGWPEPVYGHVPLIHGPDGAKLSKRHGALAVEAYRDMGYLPETMRNYLLRLGWSHGNDEIIPTKQAVEWFNLESIGKSPARLDFKKLDNLNAHYLREMADTALADEIAAMLARETPPRTLSALARERLVKAMPQLKERAKTLVELTSAAEFLFTDGVRTPDEAAAKLLNDDAKKNLGEFLTTLTDSAWTAHALEDKARAFAEAKGLKLGQVAQPLRAALTGKTTSPPIFAMLEVLGRNESLTRLSAHTI
ncbi:glutamyl-tRNA synthetase [Rhizomicrobium palustre]|uniref:Glutamate--tRNA ligase n=1 Tax=Rhizomicrobium palustre TaxID=189966 RepID=A0A846N0W9_9PROT|nr:glutamate--tRNA ligase [Rhizomicrobium palustre]NIK89604.1 glutamyl-tRNA synthetase [Rhizomicrobium palustre]